MIKLSDYVTKFFENENVENIFMLVGGGCMHLVNSFGNSKKIKYWCTHHEQSASIAAETYSKMKNDLGVVLVTSGPGATNTITGLLSCYQDSVPVIFISGQTKVKQTIRNSNIKNLRQFGSQEVDIISIVSPITKYAVEIQDANTIRYHLEKAVFEAKNGRPGPVWLSIPLDMQGALINEELLEGFESEDLKNINPEKEDLDYLVEALKVSKRPVIIAGRGVRLSNSNSLLDDFCKKYKIPVVTPIMGIDNLYDEHICNIGRIGTKGTRAGNFTMQNSDLVISLGSRLSVASIGHEYNLFAREAKVIVVDIDKNEHLKETIKIDKIINCDVKRLLENLQHYNINIDFQKWLNRCNEWKKKYPVILEEYNDDTNGINFYKFIDILNKNTKSNMPVIGDGGGSSFYIVAQSIALKKEQRYITNGGTATMGFALPAAIGVAVSNIENKVIAITGEGSFMQNMQELETIKYHNLNIKIFVINNQGYYLIHQTQNKYFNDNFFGESEKTGISFPNLEKITNAFDIKYYKLETIKQCEDNLQNILLENGPALIEVIVDKDMEIKPLNSSELKSDGKMVAKPLEDMYPFLDRDVFKDEMIVKIVEE